jgi:murein DD-endopeptidase MepM/ murein hydrolase activator NlpD
MEAWAAVPLLQEEMKMEISLQTQDGKRIAYQTLNLEPPKIEESRIRIAKKFTENLPLMRIEKERLQNEKVFSKHQEPRLFYGEFVPPMAGDLGKLTLSDFGKRRIINGVPARPHYGTDLRAAVGTPVMAPARGRVVMASDQFFSGKIMILDHGIGLFTYAIHLSKFLKKVGDLVEPGEVIALSGATGRVEGPHLHWSAKLRGVNFDAMDLIRSRLVPPETVETPGRSGIPSPGPS